MQMHLPELPLEDLLTFVSIATPYKIFDIENHEVVDPSASGMTVKGIAVHNGVLIITVQPI